MKRIFIPIGLILGGIIAYFGGWDLLEPVIGLATVSLSIATYLQTQKAKKAAYKDNGDGKWVVAFQVGRPVAEAVNKQFGQLDALINVVDVIGSNTIVSDSDYSKLAKAVYKAAMEGQGKNVHLVMSGPVGLSFLVGQLVGLHHINITVYQFDMASGSYQALPKASRDML